MNTRKISKKQETRLARFLDGQRVVNSGATAFKKGDISSGDFLIECKTRTKSQKEIKIKKEWLLKIEEEAFAMNKIFSALAFSFGPGQKNYIIITEEIFKKFIEEK